MKRWLGWAGAVYALSVVGASAAPPAHAKAHGRQPHAAAAAWCTAIQVVSTPAGGDGASVPTFSTAEILDVSFQVRLPDLTGKPGKAPASFVLKLFTPNGHLYQESVVPVRAKPKVRAVTAGPFPVAGTSITQSALFGTWRVVALPVGNTAGCSASFVLEP